MTGPSSGSHLPRWRRWAPVLALMVLAPWAGECSWGGFSADLFVFVVVVLAPLYGAAAVLIREVAVRVGGGWPAIVLLAAAFGIFQAGLVDQALFNPGFTENTAYADEAKAARATTVPLLGFSAGSALTYVGNHIALSICAPIAIVESYLVPARRHQPWLGRPGLIVMVVLFVLGCSIIFFDEENGRKGFLASPLQLAFAALTVLALIGAALLPRWRRRPRPVAGRSPHPLWAGMLVFGARFVADPHDWAAVGLQVAVTTAAAAVIVVWSRRAGWNQRHVLTAWAAALVSAAVFAYFVPNYDPRSRLVSATEALLNDIAISAIVLALLGGAYWRLRHSPPGSIEGAVLMKRATRDQS